MGILPSSLCIKFTTAFVTSVGADRTLRIWNNVKRAEIARLSHNSPIVNVNWLEGDIGVVTLGEDGIVGKWTRMVSIATLILVL